MLRYTGTMRIALLFSLCGLAGCAGMEGSRAFSLTAEEVNGAWDAVFAREQLRAEAEGSSPFWLPPPHYSGAQCRWIEPDRAAHCRYRVSRGFQRPGRPRHWVTEEATLYRTDRGWDFGG